MGLIGPNGAEEKHLLWYLSGIIKAKSGDVLLDGVPVTHFPTHIQTRRDVLAPSRNICFQGIIRPG